MRTVNDLVKGFMSSKWLVVSIILYGVLCRSHEYLINRSLRSDEARYAVKITQLSYEALLNPLKETVDHLHIKFNPGPLGFFYFSKFFAGLAGDSEYILRLVPFISGVLSLFFVYKIAQRYLEPLAVITALFLFSTLRSLIYRSADFHPYASDVLITLLLYLMMDYLKNKELNKKHIVLFSLLGAVAIFFSFPAIFTLAGLATSFIIITFAKEKKPANSIMIIFFFWAISFIFYYLSYLRLFLSTLAWNEGGMMPILPAWDWLPELAYKTFAIDPMNFLFWYLPAVLYLAGCVSLYLRDKEKFLYLSLPTLFTFFAAGIRVYPFSGRTILFLMPAFIFFIAEGISLVHRICRPKYSLVTMFVLIFLLLQLLKPSVYYLIHPFRNEEIRSVIRQAKKLKQKDDLLYVHYLSAVSMGYYGKKFGFIETDYLVGNRCRLAKDLDKCLELGSLKEHSKVWIIYFPDMEGGRRFIGRLNRVGQKLYEYKEPGASLVLYDMQKHMANIH